MSLEYIKLYGGGSESEGSSDEDFARFDLSAPASRYEKFGESTRNAWMLDLNQLGNRARFGQRGNPVGAHPNVKFPMVSSKPPRFSASDVESNGNGRDPAVAQQANNSSPLEDEPTVAVSPDDNNSHSDSIDSEGSYFAEETPWVLTLFARIHLSVRFYHWLQKKKKHSGKIWLSRQNKLFCIRIFLNIDELYHLSLYNLIFFKIKTIMLDFNNN